MKKGLLFFCIAMCWNSVIGQLPDTDIFISEITYEGTKLSFSTPVNMTRRKGYDNQPTFSQDGLSFYFVSINKDTTQSDIYNCDLVKHTVNRFTKTTESEYSPRLTPYKEYLSVVRVDADSGQRFYLIPLADPRVAKNVYNSDSIGYYSWLSDSLIAMFVLGPTNSLQVLNIFSGEKKVYNTSIGRCLKSDLKRNELLFVDKTDTTQIMIRRMNIISRKIEPVVAVIPGSEDFEILADGTLLMGHDGKLYTWRTGETYWHQQVDFRPVINDFYRIVVDPTGKRIALVAYTGAKP